MCYPQQSDSNGSVDSYQKSVIVLPLVSCKVLYTPSSQISTPRPPKCLVVTFGMPDGLEFQYSIYFRKP